MNMLAEVDIGKATLSYQTTQAVVPKLLSHTVNHLLILPREFGAPILWYIKLRQVSIDVQSNLTV